MRLIPGSEGGGHDLDDGIFCKSLGPDKLIVASIVHNIEDSGGPCSSCINKSYELEIFKLLKVF